MTKEVYVITYGYHYESSIVAAVYSNKESAEGMIAFMKSDENFDGYDFYTIETFELDSIRSNRIAVAIEKWKEMLDEIHGISKEIE